MIEIKLSVLEAGQLIDHEIFEKDGTVLIQKGTKITAEQLDSFRKRNIATAYINDSFNDKELDKILTTEFKSFDDIAFQENSDNDSQLMPNVIPDRYPELKDIEPGKKGLTQLLDSKKCHTIDIKIEKGFTDKPVGLPLKKNAKQKKEGERTEEEKIQFKHNYEQGFRRTKILLDSLAEGTEISMESIRHITSQVVYSFLMDRDFLLNLSTIKAPDDDYIYSHSLNTCILAINIAAAYGYNEQQVIEAGMGALLHDAGMLLVPKEIRLKNDRVTEDEWYEVQKHPILGIHILEKVDRLPGSVSIAAYQAHERTNGKGYPKQRSTRLIHPYAKIAAVADVFEALCSPRSYRGAIIPYRSMEMVIKMTRQGLLAGEYVKALLEYTSLFPIGSLVELSTGNIGKVIRSNGTSFAKPVVCVLTDCSGNTLPKGQIYFEDLSKNTSIQIIRAHPITPENTDIMSGF